MSFKIIADSCCDTTPQLREALDIELVPLTVLPSGGEPIVDDASFDQAKLLRAMKASREATRTACPSVDDYAKCMEKYDESLVITLSGKLSGSYNSARIAREFVLEEHPEKHIEVIDSLSASAGELLLAIHAERMRALGEGLVSVGKKLRYFADEMKTLFVLEDLSNMIKNGRVSKVKGLVASVMSIHPVLSSDGHGEVKNLHTVRGLDRAFERLVQSIAELTQTLPEKTKTLTLCFCNCEARAKQLSRDILDKCSAIREVIIAPTAGVATVYANDGGVVLSF